MGPRQYLCWYNYYYVLKGGEEQKNQRHMEGDFADLVTGKVVFLIQAGIMSSTSCLVVLQLAHPSTSVIFSVSSGYNYRLQVKSSYYSRW